MIKHLLILVFIGNAVFGQDMSGSSSLHSIDSKVYGKNRKVDIYTPYQDSSVSANNPTIVIYVFDAQFEPYFDMVSRTADYLNAIGELPTFIAVGIHTEHRPKEFTPKPKNESTASGWGDTPIGESDLLEKHLLEEVFPYVENLFPSAKLKVGIGHSLGGTFVSNTLFTEKNLFKAIISISPNMQYDNGQLIVNFDHLLKSQTRIDAFHFMVAGNVGSMENAFRMNSLKIDSLYISNPAAGLIWEYREYEGLNHSLTPLPAITEGLVKIGQLLSISDGKALSFLVDSSKSYSDHIKDHYNNLSSWMEFDLIPSVDELNGLGYLAAYEGDWSAALGVFDYAIAIYPEDANIYDSKGEALENLGNKSEAYAMYNKAIEQLNLFKDRYDAETYAFYSENFAVNAERVKP